MMQSVETEVELRFLLHHSDINSEDVYVTLSGIAFIQCRTLGLPKSHGEYTSL